MFVKKCKAIPKINFFLVDKLSELIQYRSIVATLKFYASDQTAGHGLKWTKCPAVRNLNKNATERFLQTSKEYQMFT